MTTDDREPESAESVETEAPPMIYFTIMSWGRRTSKGEGGSKSLGVLDVDRRGPNFLRLMSESIGEDP